MSHRARSAAPMFAGSFWLSDVQCYAPLTSPAVDQVESRYGWRRGRKPSAGRDVVSTRRGARILGKEFGASDLAEPSVVFPRVAGTAARAEAARVAATIRRISSR